MNLVPVAFLVLGLSNAGKYGGHDCPLAALQRQEGGNTLTATPCPDLQLKYKSMKLTAKPNGTDWV